MNKIIKILFTICLINSISFINTQSDISDIYAPMDAGAVVPPGQINGIPTVNGIPVNSVPVDLDGAPLGVTDINGLPLNDNSGDALPPVYSNPTRVVVMHQNVIDQPNVNVHLTGTIPPTEEPTEAPEAPREFEEEIKEEVAEEECAHKQPCMPDDEGCLAERAHGTCHKEGEEAHGTKPTASNSNRFLHLARAPSVDNGELIVGGKKWNDPLDDKTTSLEKDLNRKRLIDAQINAKQGGIDQNAEWLLDAKSTLRTLVSKMREVKENMSAQKEEADSLRYAREMQFRVKQKDTVNADLVDAEKALAEISSNLIELKTHSEKLGTTKQGLEQHIAEITKQMKKFKGSPIERENIPTESLHIVKEVDKMHVPQLLKHHNILPVGYDTVDPNNRGLNYRLSKEASTDKIMGQHTKRDIAEHKRQNKRAEDYLKQPDLTLPVEPEQRAVDKRVAEWKTKQQQKKQAKKIASFIENKINIHKKRSAKKTASKIAKLLKHRKH